MSTHLLPIGTNDAEAIVARILSQAIPLLGVPSQCFTDGLGNLTMTWPQQLTAPQVAALTALGESAKTGIITPSERAGIESDIDGLRTYQGLANPTLAQTVLAVKAQSRILRALLRDA